MMFGTVRCTERDEFHLLLVIMGIGPNLVGNLVFRMTGPVISRAGPARGYWQSADCRHHSSSAAESR